MTEKIERIVVVGGGTAGWMSAAYLQRMLSGATRRNISVTVVESDDVGIIGVGEATIPAFIAMMRAIDVPEYRLIAEADATFKSAIKFVDWSRIRTDAEEPTHFYHPFDPPPTVNGFNAMLHWLALKDAGLPVKPLDESTSLGGALCDANRSPKLFASGPYDAPLPYAYHIDAVKLGRLLRTIATERGVERVVDHVVSVDQDDEGNILALQTRDGRNIEGDFFIDCTGFRSLLIESVLGAEFESYTDRLLCDKAIVCQVQDPELIKNPRTYTTATAKEAGWTWEIDLTTRSGIGYVYSSQFTDDARAMEVLLDHVGRDRNPSEPRQIEMRVGRRRETWVKNCLAVGLSGGFLEPLESTGLHLIELALRVFADHMAEGAVQQVMREQYNRLMRDTYEEIADFLVMHYIFNNRKGEPFWDHCREGLILPATLVAKLQLWAHKVPSNIDLYSRISVFDGFSYLYIMAGMGAVPLHGGNLSPFLDLEGSAKVLDDIHRHRGLAVRASPKHADVLQKMRSITG